MVETMRNHMAVEMFKEYQVLVYRLKKCGVTPKRHIMDNETSEYFKDAIKKNKMVFQLVSPHDYCINIADKAIQMFKNHLISILCDVYEIFHMPLWYLLLQQAKLTLSLLGQ